MPTGPLNCSGPNESGLSGQKRSELVWGSHGRFADIVLAQIGGGLTVAKCTPGQDGEDSDTTIAFFASGQHQVWLIRTAGDIEEPSCISAFKATNNGQLARWRLLKIQCSQETAKAARGSGHKRRHRLQHFLGTLGVA